MHRFFQISALVLAITAAVFTPLTATDLTNEASIASNSTTSVPFYVLNPDAYEVPTGIATGINISGSMYNSLRIDTANTTLTLNAAGRFVTSSLLEVQNFDISAGSLTATGGNVGMALGLRVNTAFTQSGSSVVSATGGVLGHGIEVSSSYQMDGQAVLRATGGTGYDSHGLDLNGTFTQNDSSQIIATAGSTNRRQYGIRAAGGFTQNDSSQLTAIGGGGSGSQQYGVATWGNFVQTGAARLAAIGGTGTGGSSMYEKAAGLFINRSASFGGTVRIERRGAATSIYVYNAVSGDKVTFQSGSRLETVVDLSQADDSLASGLIQAQVFTQNTTAIDIQPGALLAPVVQNEQSLAIGASRDVLFMDTSADVDAHHNGTIDGTFDLAYRQTQTLRFDAYKNANNDKYYLTIERFETPQATSAMHSLVLGGDSRNSIAILDAIQAGLPAPAGAAETAVSAIYTAFDNAVDDAGYRSLVMRTGRSVAPQQATRIPLQARNRQDAVLLDFSRNLSLTAAIAVQTAERAAASDAALASLSCLSRPWRIWANPVYQHTSHRHGGTLEFDNNKEWFAGAALGVARDFGMATIGLNTHYLRGDVEASGYDADSDTYGVSLGARFHDFVPAGGRFNPFVETIIGYARENIDQKRTDYSGNRQHSKPKIDLFSAGLTLGNPFAVGDCLTLTPLVGADYMHVSQKRYGESGAGYLGLKVKGKDYDSLRLKAGFEAKYQITDKVDVNARALYRYETLDRETRLTAGFQYVPAVRFATYGERLNRSSGNVGAGIGVDLNDRTRLGANYDLWLADKHVAHQGSLSIAVRF